MNTNERMSTNPVVGMKSGTTFLISSVQPEGTASSSRLKGVFRKALQ